VSHLEPLRPPQLEPFSREPDNRVRVQIEELSTRQPHFRQDGSHHHEPAQNSVASPVSASITSAARSATSGGSDPSCIAMRWRSLPRRRPESPCTEFRTARARRGYVFVHAYVTEHRGVFVGNLHAVGRSPGWQRVLAAVVVELIERRLAVLLEARAHRLGKARPLRPKCHQGRERRSTAAQCALQLSP
jgi:hypothetical protein